MLSNHVADTACLRQTCGSLPRVGQKQKVKADQQRNTDAVAEITLIIELFPNWNWFDEPRRFLTQENRKKSPPQQHLGGGATNQHAVAVGGVWMLLDWNGAGDEGVTHAR